MIDEQVKNWQALINHIYITRVCLVNPKMYTLLNYIGYKLAEMWGINQSR